MNFQFDTEFEFKVRIKVVNFKPARSEGETMEGDYTAYLIAGDHEVELPEIIVDEIDREITEEILQEFEYEKAFDKYIKKIKQIFQTAGFF